MNETEEQTTAPDNSPQSRLREYRGFDLYCEPQHSLWEVASTVEGTRVPTVLRGKFTSLKLLHQAVDKYLSGKGKKKSDNGNN
jgi:hypothetical protein